jgi:hypothetical protein
MQPQELFDAGGQHLNRRLKTLYTIFSDGVAWGSNELVQLSAPHG